MLCASAPCRSRKRRGSVPDRIAALETRVAELEAKLEQLLPKPTALELAFPGRWQKRWSGKDDDFDASGTEVFEVRGEEIVLLQSSCGSLMRWQCSVESDGKNLRLEQSKPSSKLKPISVELTGDAQSGYLGSERVGEHSVTVSYLPFTGDIQRRTPRKLRPSTPSEWQELARSRKLARVARTRKPEK